VPNLTGKLILIGVCPRKMFQNTDIKRSNNNFYSLIWFSSNTARGAVAEQSESGCVCALLCGLNCFWAHTTVVLTYVSPSACKGAIWSCQDENITAA